MPLSAQKRIETQDLVCLNDLAGAYPLRVDLVYAQQCHRDNMFKEAIYRPDARMWGHRDLVGIICRAAEICFSAHKLVFELKDCLRTVEAQQKICDSAIVRAHPQWLAEPVRLFSPPGKGGHPRGMAVDIILVTENGDEVDMGTRFDYMTDNIENNPAARDYTNFGRGEAYNAEVLKNREKLSSAMMQAAREKTRDLLPLPQEWWDFRFPNEYSATFAPISDRDLPPQMRMTDIFS
jgi:D-alanyl-D-alanine dipeptidase